MMKEKRNNKKERKKECVNVEGKERGCCELYRVVAERESEKKEKGWGVGTVKEVRG